MITLPPSERDLHAYIDGQLDAADRQALNGYLAAHPVLAEQVRGWQADAQALRAELGAALLSTENPALDPVAIRQRLRKNRTRRFANAAVLLIAVCIGAGSGWQARELSLRSDALPMADAVLAYRMFAVGDTAASDWNSAASGSVQTWLDQQFARATRLPALDASGFKPVSARLTSTEHGAAVMVVYRDEQGRTLSFYVRPPGDHNRLLPRGSRRDGELQADYWSGDGYNYAVISPANDPAVDAARRQLAKTI